ncbi:DnaA ATPase domain-containing protein, partial [Staphylococcus capitis]
MDVLVIDDIELIENKEEREEELLERFNELDEKNKEIVI